MSYHETGLKYSVIGIVGTLEDKDGKRPLIGIHTEADTPINAVVRDIEEKTGVELEVIAEISSDGRVKTFGFSSWKGSSWVPEGPKPNWVTPGKKLN